MSRKGLPSPALDVGSGSGILAIATLLLGDGKCTAVDNDPEAVEAARMNARLNHVEACLDVRKGTAASVRRSFPLVLANLEYRIFLTEAERIARRVAAGGTLLISGLLEGQERDTQALFKDLHRVKMKVRDGWVMIKLSRHSPRP